MFKQRKQRERQDGFTIIEVLIVLAIAGLIMVVVFLAVPALQRSQRNQSRKTDADNLMSAIGGITSNNGGTFAAADLTNALANTKLGYYASTDVSVPATITTTANPGITKVFVYPNYTCGAAPTDDPVAQNRATAVIYAVETGSSATGTRQCVSS